jgi:hypothetical protein
MKRRPKGMPRSLWFKHAQGHDRNFWAWWWNDLPIPTESGRYRQSIRDDLSSNGRFGENLRARRTPVGKQPPSGERW